LKKKGVKRGFPRFKSIDRVKSLYYPQFGFKLGSRLDVAPFGSICIVRHREIEGRIKTLTLKRETSGKWFAIFTVEQSEPMAKENYNPQVGVDVGLTHFATFSDGLVIENPRYFKKHEQKLKFLHRKLSKRIKRSRNHWKARRRLSVAFEKVSNARSDFLHKLSTEIVRSYSFIALENLEIKKMSGKRFGKSIYDVSWGMFVRMLDYKAESAGCQVVLVNPKNTSKQCSCCGYLVEKNLSERVHMCPECGLVTDRDLNAAKNILAKATAGMAGSNACEVEEASSSVKQEAQGLSFG